MTAPPCAEAGRASGALLILGITLLVALLGLGSWLGRGPLAALDLALLAEAEALNRLPLGLVLPELPPADLRPGG
ncbi:hypothetical protein [Pseudoroseomonas cervicalis]|uniref:hypothetical protein n=1 Tax=Teichococcus cervicalis TaxID=204525 RepID=UPI0022F179E7|nr:hypothetical protein [Pseudoroseomonas cervicalis]WBV45324.1 hypothetical protein PFY06_20890 [Pseudoroseomonas cervicalis]